MIRKFVMGAVLAIMAAGVLPAQDAPQDQQPAAQQPATQPSTSQTAPEQQSSSGSAAGQQPTSSSAGQASEEPEITARRRRAPVFSKYEFNVGVGADLGAGVTQDFIKGGALTLNAGAARNFNHIFGFRLDFFYADLPLRANALQIAQASTGTNRAFAFTLDPIFNIPVSQHYGGYLILGPDYIHRSGSLTKSVGAVGGFCNAFWTWWGNCNVFGLPPNRTFLSTSVDQYGYNYGAGLYRRFENNHQIYLDFRALHGTEQGVTTDFRTLTLGVRW